MMKISKRQAACSLALFLVMASSACAGSFQVSPVRAILSSNKPVTALTVRNTGADPAVIQLEALSWAQNADKDVYAPAPDILATPPIFTIPAGGSQVIRIGSRAPAPAGIERSYRLFLREVPPPAEPGFRGLRMALQISIPVFVLPASMIAPDLHWRAATDAQGMIHISVTNGSTAHLRLRNLALTRAGDPRQLLSRQLTYVLAGATRDWLIKRDTATPIGSTLHITAQTDDGPLQADLVVSNQ